MSRGTTLGLLGLSAALAIGGVVFFVVRQSSEAPPLESPVVPRTAELESELPVPASTGERIAVPETDEDAIPPSVVRVRGRVVDSHGTPVPDVAVGILDERVGAKSDASGTFQIEAADLPCSIVVVDPLWTTLRMGEVTEAAPLVPAIVVAASAVTVRGMVVDPQARPLAGARLRIRPEGGERGTRREWEAESAADGTFTIARAPAVENARLTTLLAEFAPDERTLALPPQGRLRIVLVPAPPEGPVLTGTVVRPDGSSVPGATVSFGSARARSDIHGRFRLVCGWFDAETPLVAGARKSSPVVLERYGARVECGPTEHPPVQLVLPGLSLSITGRVVDANGRPVKGWRVALADPTPLDPGGVSPDIVEELGDHRTTARTDGEGRFEIDGLVDRFYALVAIGRDRSSRAEVFLHYPIVRPGSGDVVIGPPLDFAERVIAGRVLTGSGQPVQGAEVGLERPAPRMSGAGGKQGRPIVYSDPQGRFELPGVHADAVSILVTHEGFLAARHPLEFGENRIGLVIRVRGRAYLSFDGSAAPEPPEFLRAASPGSSAQSWRLDDGVLDFVELAADVREIVLYRGCREVGRVPVALDPENATRVVWP